MKHFSDLLSFSFLIGAMALAAFAQTGSSAITGIVKDPSDAPIPGVTVRILNLDTGVQLETLTNDAGVFRISALVPGNYRLQAELPGFSRLTRGPIMLQVSQTLAIDLPLQLGQIDQAINVTDAAPLLESRTSDIGQVIDRQKLEALPLPNRAASSLAALAPGVVMIDPGTGTAENYPIFSVAGGRARNQTFVLDGANVTNAVGLTRPQQLTTLPVDAMQEFRVIANNYAAEYGHSTGGIVTMSTRSGTNQFGGTLFESLRNDALDARNFFAAQKPVIRLNQFGATFGGPIQKGKTHFFTSWEQTRQRTSDTVTSTVPTISNRNGDFSGLRNSDGQPVVIYDPATTSGDTRTAFADNRIPAERIDPVARAVLDYYPLPNRQGTAANAGNYVGNTTATLFRNIGVGRLDHRFSTQDFLTARYYLNDSDTYNSGTYGIPVSDPLADITDVRVQSLLGGYTHVFATGLVNELHYTYLRRKFIDRRPGYMENLAADVGLEGVSPAAFPAFTIPGYATLGNPAAVSRFQTPIVDQQIQDSLAWINGKHAMKFGAELRFGANDEIRDRSSSGTFTITPLITSLPGVAGTGNALASFLLGEVNAAGVVVSEKIRSRASYWAFYAQDDWRISDGLTLNYGLRWETELPRRVLDNRMNSFDPGAINPVSGTPGVVIFAGVNGTPKRAFAADKNNFGPRVGFAYRIPGSRDTVIRGGGGFFYGSTISNTVGDAAALGFSTQASFVVAQADRQSVFRLRDGFPAVTLQPLTPGFGAVPPGQRPNTSVEFFNPEQVAPVSYQYNLDVQREFVPGFLIEAGYIANVSHHLTANDFSLNQVPAHLMGAGDAQLRRPFPQFSNVTWINPSIGNSTYHGGFIRTEKRSGKFAFLAHYTFSKFLDDVESANEYGSAGSYMDAYNRRLDKGRSGSDVPHHLVVSVSCDIPTFAALRNDAVMKGILSGWKLGLLETYMSGPPFTVTTAANTTNAFSAGPLRPDLLHNPSLPRAERTVSHWFDTTAFAAPSPFTFGNSPRSVLRGAPVVTTDVTVEKSFALSERLKFDLRSEFYNLLNHANFNAPGAVLGATDFGVVTSARSGRTVQLSGRLSF